MAISNADKTDQPDPRHKYRTEVLARAGEPILDIPDARVLERCSPQALVDTFTHVWGRTPNAVVVPVCSADGVNFAGGTCGLPVTRAVRGPGAQFDFAAVAKQFVDLDCDLYLSIDPTLAFVNVDPLQLVDSRGGTNAQLCVGKRGTQELVGITLADAVNLTAAAVPRERIRGVVCDLVNLWPMGARGGRLELTCFCSECLSALGLGGAPDIAAAFFTHPSPWNLLLAESESGDGISHISDFGATVSAAQLVGLSKVRGFTDIFGDVGPMVHEDLAARVMDYLQARHGQTVDAIQACRRILTSYTREDGPLKLNIITEGERYSWNAGLFLDRLDSWETEFAQPPIDEIWYNPAANSPVMGKLPFRCYMWDRSRYVIDHFFQFAASVSDPGRRATTGIGRLPVSVARQVLEGRLRAALGGEVASLASLIALPTAAPGSESVRQGFVGVGLSQDLGQAIIDGVEVAPDFPTR